MARVEESTGKVEAEKVKEVLDNWGVAEKVIACGFDTTSANRQLRFAPEPAPETAPLAGLPSPRPRARTGSCLILF